MNSVNLIGRLTDDPEIRTVGQTEKATFTIAVDRGKDKNGNTMTDFPRCVAWGKSAEFAGKYLSKGMKVGVSGRLQTGSYDGQNGQKVYTTDVNVSDFTFCEKKADNPNTGYQPQQTYQQPAYAPQQAQGLTEFEEVIGATDLPF